MKNKRKKPYRNERIINGILAAIIIFSVLTLGYSMKTMFFPPIESQVASSTMQVSTKGKMSLTFYDKELALSLIHI